MEESGRKVSCLQAFLIGTGCIGLLVGGCFGIFFVFGARTMSTTVTAVPAAAPLPAELEGTCQHALLEGQERRLVHAYFPLGQDLMQHGHQLGRFSGGSHTLAHQVGTPAFLDLRLDARRAEDGSDRVAVVRVRASAYETDEVRLLYRARDCRIGEEDGDPTTAEGELEAPVTFTVDEAPLHELAFRFPPEADHASFRLEAVPPADVTEPLTLRLLHFEVELVAPEEYEGEVRSSW